MTEAVPSRQQRKQRTRQTLLEAALRLLDERSLASLSLREVAREAGIVPTAFYRHFESMDDLGVALVEECTTTLRALTRQARAERSTAAIGSSVRTLAKFTRSHRAQLGFLARERYGGVAAVRLAVNSELRLFASELATDLARFPAFDRLDTEDLRMAAELMVAAMLNTVLSLLEVRGRREELEQDVLRTAEAQLRLIVLGMTQWRSG